MSNALPVVAMKYGGPEQFVKNYVEEQLVSSKQSYDDIASDIAQKLELFYNDKALIKKVGEQNRKDILDNFTWEAKAEKMKKIYMELLDEKA